MTSIKMLISLAVLAAVAATMAPGQEKRGEMTVVTYDGLKREVIKHRGRVVLVDFWAGY